MGVSMMLATQKIPSDMMKGLAGTNDLKTNTSTLILGKSKDTNRAAAGMNNAYDVPDLGESVDKGRGLYESIEAGVQMVQIWFEPGGQEGMAELISTVRQPLGEDETDDYTPNLRLPQIQEGPAVEMLPPEETVVQDLGDLDLDLGDEWLADLNLDDAPDIGESETAPEAEDTENEDESTGPVTGEAETHEDADGEPDDDEADEEGFEPAEADFEPSEEFEDPEDYDEAEDDDEPEPPRPTRPASEAEDSAPLIDSPEPSPVDKLEVSSFVPDIPTIDDDDDLFAAPKPRAKRRRQSDMFASPKPKQRSNERF